MCSLLTISLLSRAFSLVLRADGPSPFSLKGTTEMGVIQFSSSTQGVDNYFQMIRRRINLLERPITSATNGNRWNGYASYNPK